MISSLVLGGCTLLSNIGQVPTSEQSGITYLTKGELLPNLVGLWSFDEGEDSTAYDSSGNNNHGTVHGASWGDGQSGFGKALSFDVDDYVEVLHAIILNPTSAITVECWAKLDRVDVHSVLVRKMNTYSLQVTVGLNGEGARLEGWVKIGGVWKGVRGVVGGTTLTSGTWYHFAFTYDGANVVTYVNGAFDRSKGVTGSIDFTTNMVNIGRCGPPETVHGYTYGLIDEVRIYDYALPPGTIEDHSAGIYGFNDLMAPYAPPEQKAFKLGSTIPLKWQYTDYGVDSSLAKPIIKVVFLGNGVPLGNVELVEINAPGSSGYQYDWETNTWQFNWQTKGLSTGTGNYNIWIASNLTGQVNGPFPIRLR